MRKNHFSFILRKRAAVILLLLAISMCAGAQSPMFFKYQAVVRDSVGLPIASSNVGIKISILKDSITGAPAYSEVHNVVTSLGGLITLNIGGGIPEQGSFINIDWGVAEYFVKVEFKPEDTDDFIFMGTSQLMSVPYALYARHAYGPPVYTWQEIINLPDPGPGMMVYVSDMKTLAYYNDSIWVVLADCPPVTPAYAGEDAIDVCNPYQLQANTPDPGNTGFWTTLSGQCHFENSLQPNTLFHGLPGETYLLVWTITNSCGETSSDTVSISLTDLPTTADAGEDQENIFSTVANMQANVPENGTGAWSIVSGTGGSFENISDPFTMFSGLPNQVYELAWSITNNCNQTSSDTLLVSFCPVIESISAGEDAFDVCSPFA
jgi:hypothetical protein